MKNQMKKIVGLLVLSFAFINLPINASEKMQLTVTETVIIGEDLIGGWEYTVAGAPEGYDAGLLMIIKVEDNYKVQVQNAGGVMNGTNVFVKGNDITFKLMVEGEEVAVSLSAKGSNMTGTSSSSTGVYNIAATKSLSPE